ncbi:MAG: hypothetical protein AAGI45_15550 [Cyanobacteria bacterium P01_H01_bin.26]
MSANSCSFLTVARQGRSSWKRYLASFSIIFIILYSFIFILGILDAAWAGIPFGLDSLERTLYESGPQKMLLLLAVVSIGLLIGLGIVVPLIHRRNFLTLINADTSIRWQRIAHGFVGFFGLWAINVTVLAIIYPQRYVWTFNWSDWWPFSLWSAMALLIQGTALVFFYGYSLQAFGGLIRQPVLMSAVWSVSLGLLSLIGNQTLGFEWIVRIVDGWLLVWLVLKDDRLELAIGIFLATAMMAWIIGGAPSSWMQFPGFFKFADPAADTIGQLGALLRYCLFLYPICFGWSSRPFSLTADR